MDLDLTIIRANQLKDLLNRESLLDAAQKAKPLTQRNTKQNISVQYTLHDEQNKPIPKVKYEIRTTEGIVYFGKTNTEGKTEEIAGYTEADCTISFFN